MKMTARRQAVALGLAAGRPVIEIAREHGISARTIHNWLAKDKNYGLYVTQLRDQMFQEAATRLTSRLSKVDETLEQLLNSQNESVRIKAARALADLGIRLRENLELEYRMQEIERRHREESARAELEQLQQMQARMQALSTPMFSTGHERTG